MNKFKKEEKRKFTEARKGLTKAEIYELNLQDKIKEQIEKLAHSIHHEKFSEEFDFMYDSSADSSDRRRGINPMSPEYIDKIRKKRSEIGVAQLSKDGTTASDETYRLCLKEAKEMVKKAIQTL